MNTSIANAQAAKTAALQDGVLEVALRIWFAKKGSCPDPEITDFEEWVEKRCDDMAGCIEDSNSPMCIAKALRVNALGDELAMYTAMVAQSEGFNTDINCYVEDNIVYANVWVSGKTAEQNKAQAEAIAKIFRNAGYSAEVWVDEVDDTDVTVNAQIDFPLYMKMQKV